MAGAASGVLTYLQASGQGLSGAFPALVNQDANGVATTPNELWVRNGNNLYVPVSDTSALATKDAPSTAIYVGSVSLTSNTTAVQLPAQPCREVLLQNSVTSGVTILVGTSTEQTIEIPVGSAIPFPVSDVSLFYAVLSATGSAKLNWIARN